MGWTRGNVAATILLVTQQQRDEIAARVRAEMERQGFTNRKLSDESGLSEKTISRLINGKAKEAPSYDTLERVGRALGISDLGVSVNKGTSQVDRLGRIEQQVNDLHVYFFGEGGEGGIAARLLPTDGSPPSRDAEPPESPAADERPRSA